MYVCEIWSACGRGGVGVCVVVNVWLSLCICVVWNVGVGVSVCSCLVMRMCGCLFCFVLFVLCCGGVWLCDCCLNVGVSLYGVRGCVVSSVCVWLCVWGVYLCLCIGEGVCLYVFGMMCVVGCSGCE